MSEDRSDDPKYLSWARAVKVKSDFICDICHKKDVYLESHHKNSWDWDISGRYDLSNSACLCKFCHQSFHKIFGYGGNHSYQFEQFKKIYLIFKNIISSSLSISPSLNASEK